jgi:hypothetical protein
MTCITCDRGDVPSREEIERIARELSSTGEISRAGFPELAAETGGGATLPPDGDARAQRLLACQTCDSLSFGVLCAQCGCFVQIRSIDPRKTCPHPAGNRWEASILS